MKFFLLLVTTVLFTQAAFAENFSAHCSKDKRIGLVHWHYDIGAKLSSTDNMGYVNRIVIGDDQEMPAMPLVKVSKTEDTENLYVLNSDGQKPGDTFNLYLTDLHQVDQRGAEMYVGTLHSKAGHFKRMACTVSH